MTDPWDRHAAWWREGFTMGADPEYVEQILPLVAERLAGSRRVLDLGTGDGQVARAAGGSLAIGVDASWQQLTAAAGRDGGPLYAMASVVALPFRGSSFDAVVACLVLEHVGSLEAAVCEVARVLAPGGTFLLLANHPLMQTPGSGWIDDRVLDEQYWRVGPYLEEGETLEEVDKGVRITFYHRPLSRYVNVMADNGLVVSRMDEPAPPEGFLALAPEYRGATSIPRLLVLEARRREP